MKTALIPTLWALALVAGCSPASEAAPPASETPQTPAAEEPDLPSPEEESAKAAETIDAANADAEMARIQAELAGGG